MKKCWKIMPLFPIFSPCQKTSKPNTANFKNNSTASNGLLAEAFTRAITPSRLMESLSVVAPTIV